MNQEQKSPTSTTQLWLKENKRRWVPAAIIILVIMAVIAVFATMSGQKKDPDDYMKVLEKRQEQGLGN